MTSLPLENGYHNVGTAVADLQMRMNEVMASTPDGLKAIMLNRPPAAGKLIRPQLLFCTCEALDLCIDERVLALASVLELVHSATLLHDDVLDMNCVRRNSPSLHCIIGNRNAILAGDYLLCLALRTLTAIGNPRLYELMSDSITEVFQGELEQQMSRGTLGITESQYFSCLKRKTGALFSAATRIPAVLTGALEHDENALADFGLLIGTAFQVADDLLDYAGDPHATGKPVGTDIRQGIATLPLLFAWNHGSGCERELIDSCFNNPDLTPEQITDLVSVLRRCQALEYTKQTVKDLCGQAITRLSAANSGRWDSLIAYSQCVLAGSNR